MTESIRFACFMDLVVFHSLRTMSFCTFSRMILYINEQCYRNVSRRLLLISSTHRRKKCFPVTREVRDESHWTSNSALIARNPYLSYRLYCRVITRITSLERRICCCFVFQELSMEVWNVHLLSIITVMTYFKLAIKASDIPREILR